MDEIEILKKIQSECSKHSMCKACTYYDGNAGCLLHSSPTCWELDMFKENKAKENKAKENKTKMYSFDLRTFVIYSILGVGFTALGFVSSILYRRLK